MYENAIEDDDSFFAPAARSNLATLFGVNLDHSLTSENVNTSLTYTAPKQPQKLDENPVSPKHQSSILIFKEVHAFQLVDKSYFNQGKCGFALIGNDTIRVYQLLLYKQKTDIISSTKIGKNFQLMVQKENYVTYSDEHKHQWTIHFNSEVDLNEFVSKVESRGGKIAGNILTTEKRENVPVAKENVETTKEIKPVESESPETTKANILTRMAKMGQKLLPNTVASDGTDSDNENSATHNTERKSKKNVPTNSTEEKEISESSKSPAVVPVTIPQSYTLINGQYVPTHSPQYIQIPKENNIQAMSEIITSPVMFAAPSTPGIFDQFQLYLTENRTQNSEVRMSLLRLTNKMEDVLDKVQKIECDKNSIDNQQTDIKVENERLKLTIDKLTKELEEAKSATKPVLDEKLKQLLVNHVDKEFEYAEKIRDLETQVKEQNQIIKQYGMQNKNPDADKLFVDKKKYDSIDETVKKIMNSLFQEISSQIQDYEQISGKDIKKMLAQKIVSNTYSIISAISELSFSDENEELNAN